MAVADWEAEEKTAAPAPSHVPANLGPERVQVFSRSYTPFISITNICAIYWDSVCGVSCGLTASAAQLTLTSVALAGLILQRVSPATIGKYPRPWMQDWRCIWPHFSTERNVAFAMVLAALLLALAWEDDCAPGLNGAEFSIVAHVLESTQRTLLDCIDWNLMRLWRGKGMRIAEGEILKLEKLCKRREIVAANNASTSAAGIVFSREEVEMCLGAALMKAVCDKLLA